MVAAACILSGSNLVKDTHCMGGAHWRVLLSMGCPQSLGGHSHVFLHASAAVVLAISVSIEVRNAATAVYASLGNQCNMQQVSAGSSLSPLYSVTLAEHACCCCLAAPQLLSYARPVAETCGLTALVTWRPRSCSWDLWLLWNMSSRLWS